MKFVLRLLNLLFKFFFFFLIVAALALHCSMQALRCGVLASLAVVQELLSLWCKASVVVAYELSRCGTWA